MSGKPYTEEFKIAAVKQQNGRAIVPAFEVNFDATVLLIFARIVKEVSFTRAADRLGIPSSTLSRQMSMLEA